MVWDPEMVMLPRKKRVAPISSIDDLNLDPEAAPTPQLGGLDSQDVELPGDRFRRMREEVEQGQGFRWNPASETGAQALRAQQEKLIGITYGDQGLKADNLRARTEATRAKMERDADLAEGRKQVLEQQISKYKYQNSDAARAIVEDAQKELARLRGGQADEQAHDNTEGQRALKDREREAGIDAKKASTKLTDQRVQKLIAEAPTILAMAKQKLANMELDPQFRQAALDLRASIANATNSLDLREKALALDALEAELKALKQAPDPRGFIAKRAPIGMGGEVDPRATQAAAAVGELDRARGNLSTSAQGSPVSAPKVYGAGPVQTPKVKKSPIPAVKPSGDTQPATTAGAATAIPASRPAQFKEGGALARKWDKAVGGDKAAAQWLRERGILTSN